jgi:hypothetical protein
MKIVTLSGFSQLQHVQPSNTVECKKSRQEEGMTMTS